MVEVFRTNVTARHHANMLLNEIHQNFTGYKANFDLDDCDNILRILSLNGPVDPSPVIDLFNELGFTAEVLPDDIPLRDDATLEKGRYELKGTNGTSNYFDMFG